MKWVFTTFSQNQKHLNLKIQFLRRESIHAKLGLECDSNLRNEVILERRIVA